MKKNKKFWVSSALIATLALTPIAALADAGTPSTATTGTTATGTATTGTATAPTTATTTTTATDTSATSTDDVGMTPDDFFYFLKQFGHNVNVWITFDDSKKADLLIEYANGKAAELKVLNGKGISKYNEDQLAQIEKMLNEAADLVDKLDQKTEDSANNTDSTNTTTPTGTTTD
ncbi:MAG: DUF5667 domain-containing protein, partial [Tumebacillaceae bacterium]